MLQPIAGPGIPDSRVRAVAAGIQAYWQPHGLRFEPTAESVSIPWKTLFAARNEAFEGLAQRPDAAAERLYARLRELMRRHASPRPKSDDDLRDRHVINVVIVGDVVHPSAAAAAVLGDLVGLTLAPTLLADGRDEIRPILQALNLPPEFTPTVLLSDRHLRRMSDVSLATAAAHEVGHALGLRHHEARGNLMAEGRHDCVPGLEPGQLERVNETLGG
jgi:hypothetical protein